MSSSAASVEVVPARPGHVEGAVESLRPELESAGLGLVLGLGVVLPLVGGKPTFLLDWVTGPAANVVSTSVLGLNGGLTTGVLGSVSVAALGHLVGPAVTWLVMLSIFPLATVGAGRLTGGSRWARLAAGTLYAVNPFVFNRLYVGHLTLLVGYALLPFAAASALAAPKLRGLRALGPALWWSALTALSPHFAWIYGVLVVAGAVANRRFGLRAFTWVLWVSAAFALMSTYILLPHTATELPAQAGAASLDIYRTTGDAHLGLFVNVLGLYGFWRLGPGPQLPKAVVGLWPLLLAAILIVGLAGAWGSLRATKAVEGAEGGDCEHGRKRGLLAMLAVAAVAGYLLSLGDQGPTGPLFRWAYYHVPFFQVMREPQKFSMLVALSYAVFFGWGVDRMSSVDLTSVGASAKRAGLGMGLAGIVLPLAYCPTIFWGLAGQVTPSSVPTSYSQADQLMGKGQGQVLYLPWHLYMAYPFTGRVVANLAPSYFRRDVISGDNIEVGAVKTQSTSPRSAFVQTLLAKGDQLKRFGALVAPLGVEYVVLAKTADWVSYAWLGHQGDLKLVYESPSLEIWRNQDYAGQGERVARPVTVRSLPALIKRAEVFGPAATGGLNGGAITIASSSSPGSRTRRQMGASSAAGARPRVHELSPVAYQVPAGHPGWVSIAAPYQQGWSLNGKPAFPTAAGTMMFRVGEAGGVARFGPWESVKLGYAISSGAFLTLAVALLVCRRRREIRAD